MILPQDIFVNFLNKTILNILLNYGILNLILNFVRGLNMKFQDKFGVYGIDDERTRKTLFPTRVVLKNGNVNGENYLTEYKPVQVAIYRYHDQCVLDNRGSDTHAAVLVDFGRELHGTVNLSIWSINAASAQFKIRLGESVSEALSDIGVKNATNDHAQRDMIMTSGPWSSNETNESGFRFAYVELLTPDVFAEIRSICAVMVFRDIEYKGYFECSDPLVTKIYDTAAYTVHLNMQRYLWDGIKRDRLVWAGDMNTEVAAILSVFGANDVVPKSLDFVRSITPPSDYMNGIPEYSLWWLLCQHEWYMGTGNYEYLASQKEYIKELIPRYINFVNEEGSENLPGRRFFDWPTNDFEDAKHCGVQGLVRYALISAGDILKTLGDGETAWNCYHTAERMLAHKPNPGKWKQPAALMVMGGLADPKEAYDNCISVGGAEGLSTFLGYYTLTAAAKAGEFDGAMNIMRDYWGGMLKMGATTFWEDFNVDWMENSAPIDEPVPEGKKDIHGDFGAFCYKGLRHSLCHGWASGPAPYIAENVLGVTPVEPGYKKVKISPQLSGLEWIKGAVPTPYGNIEIEADKNGVKYSVPQGIEA